MSGLTFNVQRDLLRIRGLSRPAHHLLRHACRHSLHHDVVRGEGQVPARHTVLSLVAAGGVAGGALTGLAVASGSSPSASPAAPGPVTRPASTGVSTASLES